MAQADVYEYDVTFTSHFDDGCLEGYDITSYANARDESTGYIHVTGSTFRVGQYYTPEYYVFRGYPFFDTSVIPVGANITSSVLSLKLETAPTTDFNVTIQTGGTTYPHKPLDMADYWQIQYSGNGGTLNTSDMSVDTYTNITLTTDGLSWISDSGWTKFCLRSNNDINNIAPTGNEYAKFYSMEAGVNSRPILYVTYTLEYNYSADLYGAYDETGERDGSINVTFTRPNQQSLSFELDGTYEATAQTDTRLVFTFDLGNNYTRIYYLKYNEWYEDIYVFKPGNVYATYFITLVDYVGLTHGYLESILNINGTDRVIERQRIDAVNDIPFVLTWGTSYAFRLVCDQGTYTWSSIIAGADTTVTLTVTGVLFPPDTINIGAISLSATRTAEDTIQVLYNDSETLTNWVYISITELRETVPTYYTNNTGSTHDITWASALPTKDYIVYFQINHQEEGTLTWSLSCPHLVSATNPFDFGFLGDWGIIDSSQLIGFFVVFAMFGAFSRGSAKVGIISTLLTAAVLMYIGWLDISWGFFSIIFCIGVLAAFSIHKKTQGGI